MNDDRDAKGVEESTHKDRVWIAAFAALPATIAATAALIVGLNNGAKTETVQAQVAEVHTLTNSNLSRVTRINAVLTEKVEELEKLIARLVEDKNAADRAATAAALKAPRK